MITNFVQHIRHDNHTVTKKKYNPKIGNKQQQKLLEVSSRNNVKKVEFKTIEQSDLQFHWIEFTI